MSSKQASTRSRFALAGVRPAHWISGLLFLLLIAVATLQGAPEIPVPLDLDSNAPSGLLGLRLWLESMDFQIIRIEGETFALPPESALLFVYPNRRPYSREEAEALHRWVDQGGTLAIIGPEPEDVDLIERFDLGARSRAAPASLLIQRQPILPEAAAEIPYLTLSNGISDAAHALVVLGSDNGATLATVRRIGAGTLWHLSRQLDFTNAKLQADEHGQLLPPLLRHIPDRGTIAFDTYHLYGGSGRDEITDMPATLREWATATHVGRATLFAFAAFMCYIILAGRRLGPALVATSRPRRREAGEHAIAMAALQRRAHARNSVAHHQKRRLKIGISHIYHIDADLPDRAFVAHLTTALPKTDVKIANEAASLLDELDQIGGEEALVRTAARVDRLLADATAQNPQRISV